MAGPRWLDDGEQRAWRALQMMQVRLTASLARDLSFHSGLGYQDYGVLVVLTDRPDGRARLFELSRWLGWEKSRLSHHVSRMVDRGLVLKRACASDRRGAVVEVTALGRQELAAAAPSHVEAVRRLFIDALAPGQLAALTEVCNAVLTAIEEEEGHECDQSGPGALDVAVGGSPRAGAGRASRPGA